MLSITTQVPSFVALDLQTSEKSGGDSTPPSHSGTRNFQSPTDIGLTDEPKVCYPICHIQFHISVIAHHADSCAENPVQAHEAAYDDLFK